MSKYKQDITEKAETKLGKISKAYFGFCGYQECQLGLSLEFKIGEGEYVNDFIAGGWAPGVVDPNKYCKWTEKERREELADMATTVSHILVAAKAKNVSNLVGKPVEVKIGSFQLKSWRILTEVL